MREPGSSNAAGTAADSQKRVAGSRLPPLSVPPTPQTMLQDSQLPALNPSIPSGRSLNPIGSGRGVEDWSTRSSRTLSSGAGVARRRITADITSASPLQPLRRPAGITGVNGGLGNPGPSSNSGLSGASSVPSLSSLGTKGARRISPLDAPGLGSPSPVFKLSSCLKDEASSRAAGRMMEGCGAKSSLAGATPLQPSPSGQLRESGWRNRDFDLHKPQGAYEAKPAELAKGAQRPPNGDGKVMSRPHGFPLRRELQAAEPATLAGLTTSPHPSVHDSALAPSAAQPATPAPQGAPAGSEEAGPKAEPKADTVQAEAPKGAVTDPKYAAKCAAVASLQRLFFEEVGRSGDANAAAAAALLRLAEESRPAPELAPACQTDCRSRKAGAEELLVTDAVR